MWGEKNGEGERRRGAREERGAASAVGDVRSGRDCGGRYSTADPATCCFPVDFSPHGKAERERGETAGIATAAWAFPSRDCASRPSEMLAHTGPVSTL